MRDNKRVINVGDQFLIPLENIKRVSFSNEGFELVDTRYGKDLENKDVLIKYIGDGIFENRLSRVKINGFDGENTIFGDISNNVNDYRSFDELYNQFQKYLKKPLALNSDTLTNIDLDTVESECSDFLKFKNEYAKKDLQLELKSLVSNYFEKKSGQEAKCK